MWGRLGRAGGLTAFCVLGIRDALGEWNSLCPGRTSKLCILSLALPLLSNAGCHSNGVFCSPEEGWREQWAGTSLTLSLSLSQFGSGRIRQSVSQGLSLDKKSPGYGTQKPLFEQEELCTENW